MAEPDQTDRERELPPRRTGPLPPGVLVGAGVLILIPIVALMWVGSYSKATPELWGFPFFYWYQLLWVFGCAGLCGLSFWLLKRERDAFRRERGEVDR